MVLRDFNMNDIDSLVLFLNGKNVSKFLTSRIPQPYSIDDAKWWVNTGSKNGITKAVEINGKLVGTIGVITGEFESNRSAEIGYWFEQNSWGKGIATEAVMTMTNDIFFEYQYNSSFRPSF